jgi:uncharacterized protein
MKITQSFTVARPLPAVWALFQDVPAIARYMPGAELSEDKGGGLYAGRVGIRLGPFQTSFEGEAQVTADERERSGHVEGKGLDRRGGSRTRLVLDYRLREAEGGTRVDIDADVQLSGPIAQFGRTGIITETASVLIGQFAANVEAALASAPVANAPAAALSVAAAETGESPAAGSPAPPPSGLSRIGAFGILLALIASLLRRLIPGRRNLHR